jgi:hypothetical protein
MQIASIRQIELLAMLALPPRRTLHRQTQEFELPLLQRRNGRKRSRQNKIKKSSVLNLLKKILPPRIRFLNR